MPLAPAQEALSPGVSSPAELFETVMGFLRRQYAVIISVALLALLLAALYIFVRPPSFTAQANLLIDTRKLQVLKDAPILSDIGLDAVTIESQLQLIKSDSVALAVINKLRLTEDPEFVGSGVLSGSATSNSVSGLTEGALRAFQKRLIATRVGLSSVIAIEFEANNPERAAQIANAVGEAYIADQINAGVQASKSAGAWLEDRISKLRDESLAAQHAVIDFRAKKNIVAAAGQRMDEQQVAELNSQLVGARARTSEARARLDQIEAVIRANVSGSGSGSGNVGTVADTLSNPIITQLRTKYLEIVSREADWSARYGRNHLAVVNLRRQIADIRASMLDELRRIAETYKSEYEIAKQRQAALERSLDGAVTKSRATDGALATLHELDSAAEQYRTLYDTFLRRYVESVQQQQSFPFAEARLISSASKAETKKKPNIIKVLLLAAVGGVGLGVGCGVMREMMDRVFRTSRQAEEALQVDCVSVLPLLKGTAQAKKLLFNQELTNSVGPRTIVRGANSSVLWTAVDSPFSSYADAIRSIKLSADWNARSSRVIGFTSSVQNEGKSTVAASFALHAAQTGARVIIIDCDLRSTSLSRMLAPSAAFGIMDVIGGGVPLEDAIWKEPSTNLSLLPAVLTSALLHSNETLGSEAMKELINRLRRVYDYIVVDLPPLIPLVDARATSQFVDFYMFIIEWGRTNVGVVEKSLAGARAVYEKLHGIVLNKVNSRRIARYDHYYSKFNYNKSDTSHDLESQCAAHDSADALL